MRERTSVRERERERETETNVFYVTRLKIIEAYGVLYRTKERDKQRKIREKLVLFNAFLFGLASLCGPVNPNLCITRSSSHYSQHYTHIHTHTHSHTVHIIDIDDLLPRDRVKRSKSKIRAFTLHPDYRLNIRLYRHSKIREFFANHSNYIPFLFCYLL